MSKPRVTICPPSQQLERFDRWQFGGRKYDAVSTETGIAWADFNRMGDVRKVSPKHSRWIPAFASDDAKLRAVLLARDAVHSKFGHFVGSHERKSKETIKRAGSFLAFLAAVAYRAWRERLDCVTIASMMDVSPTTVRQHLHKLVLVARELGFETFKSQSKPKSNPRRMLQRRQRTLRRKLYGKPDYVEGFHCWDCKVNLIDSTRSKWRCSPCQDAENAHERTRLRKKNLRTAEDRVAAEARTAELLEQWRAAKRRAD